MTAPTSSTSTPLDVGWEDATLPVMVEGEFWAFTKMLPRHEESRGDDVRASYRLFPNPMSVGGLPTGWQVRWHTHYPASLVNSLWVVADVVLFERETGGWGLCTHTLSSAGFGLTVVWPSTAYTVPELVEQVLGSDAPEERLLARDLRAFVLSRYDLTDPTEAAEATLVGLGGPLTVYPSALGGPAL